MFSFILSLNRKYLIFSNKESSGMRDGEEPISIKEVSFLRILELKVFPIKLLLIHMISVVFPEPFFPVIS